VLKDNGFFDRDERPIVSAEVRPVLAGESSAIILANAKRVMRDAWAMAAAAWASEEESERGRERALADCGAWPAHAGGRVAPESAGFVTSLPDGQPCRPVMERFFRFRGWPLEL
jgi:hypothetical protein